jgi:hypothetical protein
VYVWHIWKYGNVLALIYPNQLLINKKVRKIFLIYQPCANVVSTCRWHLLRKPTYLVSFNVGVDLSKPTINMCSQNICDLSTMCKCGLDMSVTSALKNGLFSVFMLASIYPNQLLICSQNIPNLSTMCKCGLDMSVTSALKTDLFSIFSCWRRFIQTNY